LHKATWSGLFYRNYNHNPADPNHCDGVTWLGPIKGLKSVADKASSTTMVHTQGFCVTYILRIFPPLGHENFHDDTVVVTLWMFPGLSVRKSGPAAWQVSYAISP